MDIKTLLNNIHEAVSCSVCMTTFTDPKQLPCLHSFCLHCLNGILRTSGRHDIITCPECRRKCRVPGSGNLKDLPTNFRINNLLDILAIKECNSVGAKCRNCDKRSVHSFYCFQCSAFWCDECILGHNYIRDFKQHRVLALKDMQDEDIKDVLKRPSFCQKKYHEKEELKLFCKSCVLAVCGKCVATLHRGSGHDLVELEEAANERKLEINSSIEILKQKALAKRNKISELNENYIEIQVRKASVESQIQKYCKHMIELIEAKKQDMLSEVEYQTEELLQPLEEQMTEIENSATKLETVAKTTESALTRSNDAVLANFCLDQLEDDEVENPDDIGPSHLPDLKFVENQKLLHVINSEDIGLFVVAFQKTEARHSIAEGKGIHEAVVGVEAQFILSTRNAQGSLFHGNLDIIKVDVTNDQAQDCAKEVQIQDNKDGTYKISYLVWEVDEYNVVVKLNGEHVPGSPFTLDVKSQLKVPLPLLGSTGCQDADSGASESSISEKHRKVGEVVKLTKEEVFESPSSCEVTSGDVQVGASLGRPGPRSLGDGSDQLYIEPDTGTSEIMTSEGGSLRVDGVRLTWSSGAVNDPVAIKMTLEDPHKYYGLIKEKELQNHIIFGAPVVRLQPNGQKFNTPVFVTIRLTNTEVMHSDGSFLILHGTQAPNRKFSWKDITHHSKYDSENEEIEIEIAGFSVVAFFWRLTYQILPTMIVSRLNFISFNYTLSVLFKDSSPYSPLGVLALVFMSRDTYNQLAFRQTGASALEQLKKEEFDHLCSIDGEESNIVYNNERLQISTLLGKDHQLDDGKQEMIINVAVDPFVWWNTGHVEKIPLKGLAKVRILCGQICVRGQYGHTGEHHFCERDLRGFVRRLLEVEGRTFNTLPIARQLGMTDQQCNQVLLCWKSEDDQLEEILVHWRKEQDNNEDPATLKDQLKDLENYVRVNERGEMHINHLRDLGKKILRLEHRNPHCINRLASNIHILCNDIFRDCCIEVAGCDERVKTASPTENYVRSLQMHRRVSEKEARMYLELLSSSKEAKFGNFLSCLHALIQAVKEIFRAGDIPEVLTGLRGLPKEIVDQLKSKVCVALQNDDILKLICEVCETLKKLCLNNSASQTTDDIEMWASGVLILNLLYFLKRFFQSKKEIRLFKRLQVISSSLAAIMSNPFPVAKSLIRDFNNIAQSLLEFAKFDPKKLVKFELLESTGISAITSQGLEYDKPPRDTFFQTFYFAKECKDKLYLRATANVHINGQMCTVGAFQAVIMLPAMYEEAFKRSQMNTPVAIQMRRHDAENLEVVLHGMQRACIVQALECLETELGEVMQRFETKITKCPLEMRSVVEAGTVVDLKLGYKWQSESIFLESPYFDAFADSNLRGAEASSLQLAVLGSATGPMSIEAEPASLASYSSLGSSNFPMDSSIAEFEMARKHAQRQCGRFEIHYHQTNLTGHVCVAGNESRVRVQSPSPETRFPQMGLASSPEAITAGSSDVCDDGER